MSVPPWQDDQRPIHIYPRSSDADQIPQADVPPDVPPDTPTPIPSTNTDSISLVSSSTVPPSYHTRHSSRDLQSFPISPPVPLPSPQEPSTPPPALVPERRSRQSRVRGPRSRGTSRTLLRFMEQSDPPPLPRAMTGGGGGDPFSDGEWRPQRRQAVDGGIRLAGGPLDNEGPVGEQWDYLLSS